MKYTLITNNGKIMQFFIHDVANLYQLIYGGVVITNDVFENTTAMVA